MKRPNPKLTLATSLLISFILLVAWSVQTSYQPDPRPPPVPSFEWNVQIGDTFTFLVDVRRADSLYHDELYAELNDTLVTIQITALPLLSNDWNESEFTSEVLEYPKTSLILPIIHQNGTEINSTSSDSINFILSHCILPIGGWDALDYYYPDEKDPSDYSFYCNTYYSYIEDGRFSIGHLFFHYDGGEVWEGQIGQQTGVPQFVHIWNIGMNPQIYDLSLFLQ